MQDQREALSVIDYQKSVALHRDEGSADRYDDRAGSEIGLLNYRQIGPSRIRATAVAASAEETGCGVDEVVPLAGIDRISEGGHVGRYRSYTVLILHYLI